MDVGFFSIIFFNYKAYGLIVIYAYYSTVLHFLV